MSEQTWAPPQLLTEGPLAGWMSWGNGADPYETMIGPFGFKDEGGQALCAFAPRAEHVNGSRVAIHGGALMSFADFALFCVASNAWRKPFRGVTIGFNSEFLSPGTLDGLLEARGELLRETKSLLFVRGVITQSERPVLAFSGTLKKINR